MMVIFFKSTYKLEIQIKAFLDEMIWCLGLSLKYFSKNVDMWSFMYI